MKKLIINLSAIFILSIAPSFAQKTEFTYLISNKLDQEFVIRAKIGNNFIAEKIIMSKAEIAAPFKFTCENDQLEHASVSVSLNDNSTDDIFNEEIRFYCDAVSNTSTDCSSDYSVMTDSSLSKSLTSATICFRREMTANSNDPVSNIQSIAINFFIEDKGKGIFLETLANAIPEILLSPTNEANATASTEPKMEIYHNGQKREL